MHLLGSVDAARDDKAKRRRLAVESVGEPEPRLPESQIERSCLDRPTAVAMDGVPKRLGPCQPPPVEKRRDLAKGTRSEQLRRQPCRDQHAAIGGVERHVLAEPFNFTPTEPNESRAPRLVRQHMLQRRELERVDAKRQGEQTGQHNQNGSPAV